MEFEYRLLTNREGPLAKCEVTDITQLNSYMEVLHGDFQLPGGEDSGLRWHTNPNRRIHVYERCSQFSILQNLPNAYMWLRPCQSGRWNNTIWCSGNARPSASA